MLFKSYGIEFSFKVQLHILAASKEHKAWHVRVNKAVQSEHFGPFYDAEENQRDHIALEPEFVSVHELAPSSGLDLHSCSPALLFFVWLDYPHCVHLLNELEDLLFFLGWMFMLCSGSHWKVSAANSGSASLFCQVMPVYLVFLLRT